MIDEPLLLHIETSTDVCSVAFSKGEKVIGHVLERIGKRHAALLPLMIEKARGDCGVSLKALHAICYSKGPGSYTGLRVGLSTAKGLCFALDKPLIGISTLLIMSFSVQSTDPNGLIIPMIDARRDEVYAEVYTSDRTVKQISAPLILNSESFNLFLTQGYQLYLCGDGASKAKTILKPNEQLHFGSVEIDARYMVKPGINSFLWGHFENLAYAVPHYLKVAEYKKLV